MTNYVRILGLAAGLIALAQGDLPALGATPPVAATPSENPITQGIVETAPESIGPASPVARERPLARPLPRGNPLWAVPLRSLSVTRERPLFSPSRRPPPPAVVAAPYVRPAPPPPPPPAEPDHPLLALVGTVIGDTESIGVFFDQSAQTVISHRAGQGFAGWILRSIQKREATFEKDRRTATLAMPATGAEQTGPLSVGSAGGAPLGASWMDGDGRMIIPPPAKTSQAAPAQVGPDGL
jgi:general secretion pathway protein N